jgi:hypothetical protein
LAAAALGGMAIMMLFPANLAFGVFGYLMMVVAGTVALRNRPVKPAHESPGLFFHRLTFGLFRNTPPVMEPGYDEF